MYEAKFYATGRLALGCLQVSPMSAYLPYSDKHSIQEAVVAVHFRAGFDPQSLDAAYRAAQSEWAAEFPRVNLIQQPPDIKIGEGGASFILQESGSRHGIAGFEFSRVKADASPARVVRLIGNILTIHFLDYNDWKTTLRASMKYIRAVLSHLSFHDSPIMACSLKYIDRYTFDGPLQDCSAEMLLQRGSDYLATRCFDGGPVWHCNSGWFESLGDGDDRVLNQLNVASTQVDQVPTVTIDHNAICHLKTPRQTMDSLFSDRVGPGMEDILRKMHDENVSILKALLVSEMLERIGLDT